MDNFKIIKKKYDDIIKQIEKYNHHYYVLNKPAVDDATYDEQMLELLEIERRYPEIKGEGSPTQRVGEDVSTTFSKIKHDPPMLSLSNIFSENDLYEFDHRCKKSLNTNEDITYFIELKFDGLAVEVIYEDGILTQGSTRGNGILGENITTNLTTLEDIPSTLKGDCIPHFLSMRGEVFMKHPEFERLNRNKEKNGEKPFANPRNAAAGSLRQLNPTITADRDLNAVFYEIGKISSDFPIKNQISLYESLKDIGIPLSKHFDYGNIEKIKKFYFSWVGNRHKLNFDIDGIVIKLNDFELRAKMGTTSKAPKWSTAWKFAAKEAITILKSVDYQVGRTGLITPVANLQPINIGGILVKRATLHNFDEIKRLDLKIGDAVRVKRAGDVIPKIINVLYERRTANAVDITIPKRCPSCGDELHKEEIYRRCKNPKCEKKILVTLKFFVSKNAMDIEYFGPELILKLYKAKKIKSIADIYKLSKYDLLHVERMGEKMAEKIFSSIVKRKTIPLSHFLKSLGIRNVGDHIAKVVAKSVIKFDNLFTIEIEDLMDIHEVGREAAESIYEFFHNVNTTTIIEEILKAGVNVVNEIIEKKSMDKIFGKIFVFTGSLNKFSRKEAENLVERFGGKASSSISKKTDFLVTGESPGSKYEKAKSLGVTIISEKEFTGMTGDDK